MEILRRVCCGNLSAYFYFQVEEEQRVLYKLVVPGAARREAVWLRPATPTLAAPRPRQ